MFFLRRAANMTASKKKTLKQNKKFRKRKKYEAKDSRVITGCVGLPIRLSERHISDLRPPRLGCSSRCKHASHLKDDMHCSGQGKSDDWISEDIYKRFTETDSRPLTPEQYSRRTVTLQKSSSAGPNSRKCVTPEPDTKQCQFHNRRVLILDLRRVKSVDAITRQNSITTGESVDSTYGDYDYDNRSSSVNRDSSSMFYHSTPRNFSVSRSTSPKGNSSKQKSRPRKPKDRSGSPLAYERSSSPKILEGLTLPPLHQSVLTLLGQKSGVKSSPRNHLNELGSAYESTSATQKTKKLRRHGRKKKTKDEGKESEEKEIEKPETTEGRGDNDELQETQLNELQNNDDYEEDEDPDGVVTKMPTYIREVRSLRNILDEHLCKEMWSQKEMERLNDEIEKLSVGLKKYQTDFKTKSISINEDTLLAFPRTSTHTSATFGVPSNSKVLRELIPIHYLRNYVTVTEPRLHIYNLIYQRYRILENPTGKTITLKSLQRALTEVLGRPFSDKEMAQLQHSYLNLETSYKLDSKAFAGICAFCERVYGKYELENCNECIVCSKNSSFDKERCHVKQKSNLENVDLSYLHQKIKMGETTESMINVIQALMQSDIQPGC